MQERRYRENDLTSVTWGDERMQGPSGRRWIVSLKHRLTSNVVPLEAPVER